VAQERSSVQNGRRIDPWWVAPGALLVLVASIVLVRDSDALLANHPAYPLTVLLGLAIGAGLIVIGSRRPRPTATSEGRQTRRIVARIFGVGVLVGGAALMWWLQPLPADQVALDALAGSPDIEVIDSRTSVIVSPLDAPTAGLLLYPGGKVDPRAYAAMATRLAERGYRVVILKCPYDLALLCRGAGAGFIDDELPWMSGGHSLGGPVAVRFATESPVVDGVLLWASYPLDDVTDRSDWVVASISGTQDAFTTPADIEDSKELLPGSTTFTAIDGAIHSFFGDYGIQPGDGTPTISRSAAQDRIVEESDRALRHMVRGAAEGN
jgi:pimeloyl-ACP methyl ester carboxylesterase